jgi:predicted metal-dependent hydrolase
MDIQYEIKYSERKSITITVERDRSVIVRAPFNTSAEMIHNLIDRKKYLIYKKINGINKYPVPKPYKEFVSGESILFLGRNYKLQIVNDNFEGVVFENNFLISRSNRINANNLLRNFYLKQAEEKIIPRVIRFANRLGVKYEKISILDLKYRWGSCTSKHNLNFNWRIIMAPVYVIDYIIVHELAHLIESNHTREFWNIISVQLPYYKKAKNWLKENGNLLEIDF